MSDSVIETKTKSKRQKVDKYNGFKVPTRTNKSTRWAIYIFNMINEAKPDLLLVDNIKNAYNNLVDCLAKYDDTLETWIPSKRHKYGKDGNGIILKNDYYYSTLMGIPGKWTYSWVQQNSDPIKEEIKIKSIDIINTYTVLYELIKRDIVPYMETKQWEITSKEQVKYYHTQMEKLERDIKYYEQSVINTRKTLCEYAEKALNLQKPPKLTTFD
jgi:hypothetical protein